MAYDPVASWAPPIEDEYTQRRRALLEFLQHRTGAQGLRRSASAVGRTGGIGGRGPLPSLTYNPFFSQIAGRSENFNLPSMLPPGLGLQAAQNAQAGGYTDPMGRITAPTPPPQAMPQPSAGSGTPFVSPTAGAPRSLVSVQGDPVRTIPGGQPQYSGNLPIDPATGLQQDIWVNAPRFSRISNDLRRA